MKKVLAYTLVASMLVFNSFMLLEGGVASAQDLSQTTTTPSPASLAVNYNVNVEVTPELSLLCVIDGVGGTTTMTPHILGLSGGHASTSVPCNVKTNNSSGYTLTMTVEANPNTGDVNRGVLKTVDHSFPDMDVSGHPLTYYTDDPAQAAFGFTVTSTDLGPYLTGGQYYGFSGAYPSAVIVAQETAGATAWDGTTSTIYYDAYVGYQNPQETGVYSAPFTITASI